MNNLDVFRREFLGANSWPHRKDGVPLDLLDNLSVQERDTAERELIESSSLHDDWPIIGLGHIKSYKAVPLLYDLLHQSKKGMRITIAHSIFQINQDQEMIDIVLEEVPKTTNQYELIGVLYMLSDFKDDRVKTLLINLQNHKEYLVAYNATRTLGLSTDEVAEKFRKKETKGFWNKLFGR